MRCFVAGHVTKAKGNFDPRYEGMPSDPEQRRIAMIEKVRQDLKQKDWDYYQSVLDELTSKLG